ncbi:hypothetical protein BH10CYA1_BH10CYA1_21220 [soil metagenome]
MALEDFCLVLGVGFLLVYAVTIATSVSIILEQRQRNLPAHRIRCASSRKCN